MYQDYLLLLEWGDSYFVEEGQLDQLPDAANEVFETIITFLKEISTILNHRIPQLESPSISVPNAIQRRSPSPDIVSRDCVEYDQNILTEEVENNTDSWDLCAEDLHDYIELLNELHPSIESWVPLREQGPKPLHEGGSQQSVALMYTEMIRSKFEGAPETLVTVLGDLNYQRYMRLAECRDLNLQKSDQAIESESTPATLFHDSGIGSSMPSFAPSRIALAGKSGGKLPPLLVDATSRPFVCEFCGSVVSYCIKEAWE
ncbi:hypothetical protein GQ44DRAFT_775894 [Phaeosphaeriaceae sp. PMI808]|nr:hypothetical protein GQ44DRAFT_775894 [Phaeosphaeriaceae sp. PMI808]